VNSSVATVYTPLREPTLTLLLGTHANTLPRTVPPHLQVILPLTSSPPPALRVLSVSDKQNKTPARYAGRTEATRVISGTGTALCATGPRPPFHA
jgi:hypothetical protein